MKTWKSLLLLITILTLLSWQCEGPEPEKLFTALPPAETGVDFVNQVVESDSFNINQYLYAYNGAGLALGDLNNDGLVDIYLAANQTANRLYLNQGDWRFEEVSEKAGVQGWVGDTYWTTGVSMVDLNHDGWLDIYVNQVTNLSQLEGHNLLYINNQDGTFSEQSHQYGLDFATYAQQTVFFDYDLDGDLDAYLLNHSLHELDVYVKTQKRDQRDPLAGDRLLRNDEGYFRDVSEEAGIYGSATGYGLAVGIGDLDNNGCPDIYVSNDFHENDYLYINQCDGTFKESLRQILPYCSTFSMGSDFADLNNDGRLDMMTLDMKPENEVIRKRSSGADPFNIFNYKLSFGYHEQYPRNMLHINQGNDRHGRPAFSEIAQQTGLDASDWSWSVLLADLDNDRNKDVYITNGIYRRPNDLDYINYAFHEGRQNSLPALELVSMMPDGKVANYAYRNVGKLQFESVSQEWGLDLEAYSMGAAYGDLDNDGDLDLVVNNLNAPGLVYRNNTDKRSEHNYLKIKLAGPDRNRFGIGARIELFFPDQILTQEVYPARGWLSSSDYTLTFGLGKGNIIDSLVIHWPDGQTQQIKNPAANQTLNLRYEEARFKSQKIASTPPLLEPMLDSCGLEFRHVENDFIDFTHELLMPHGLSREGPRIAVGDLNGDGTEDIFIGGAAGQAGRLFFSDLQKPSFTPRIPDVFIEDQHQEDIEAAIFDADEDGDQDIYVVSGGGQWNGDPNNADRLYLNDGTGHFTRSAEFPSIRTNGSCVVAADFNGDRRKDLFVGTRSVVGAYGYLPDSYLLWNRGDGRFEKDTSAYSGPLQSLGMVTDAVWDEQSHRLLVVGEFMPISVLEFQKSGITKKSLAHSGGWWNTIYPVDIDQDGDLDFLAGNNGLNSPLQPGTDKPVRLIVKDWDNNGQPDPLLTYYRQGKEWLFHGLDDIKKQIPAIRLRYNDYHLFAEHTLDQTFSEADLQSAQKLTAETFESALVINQGQDGFTLQALPPDLQSAPIYAFYAYSQDDDQIPDILAMGNAGINTPAIGNQKASLGYFLQGLGDGRFRSLPLHETGLHIEGEVRDIQPLKVHHQTWILIAKNNGKLEIWQNATSKEAFQNHSN